MKPSSEIITLIEKHVAGLLSDAEKAEIAHALSESAEARKLYLEYMDLNASLYWTSQSKTTSNINESDKFIAGSANRTAIESNRSILPAPVPLATENLTGDPATIQPASGYSSYLPMIGFFVMGILLTVGVYQFRFFQSDKQPIAEIALNDQVVDVRAEELKSDVIKLDTFSMNLILSNVGNVLIHAPAELQLLGPYRARLVKGQIKVNVSEEDAKGKFVVETPDGNVTDLGTEFVLNVSPGSKSSVSVLTGKVNLQVAQESLPIEQTPTEELSQGDGVMFQKGSETERLMSMVSNDDRNVKSLSPNSITHRSVIKEVSDNLQKSDTKKFYQIVPQGMRNNASAYVDRTAYLWIGAQTSKKIPEYLVGGDYVRTFNQDKINSDLALKVTLNEPCDLYILFDTHLQLPDWLLRDFTRCDEVIATNLSDESIKKKRRNQVFQSGTRIYDVYTIWKRTVREPGIVELGSNFGPGAINFKSNDIQDSAMYGIVAVPLKRREKEPSPATTDNERKIDKSASEKRNTTVSNGILSLGTTGSTANSAIINVKSGTMLDVSGLSGGALTLGSSQTLARAGTVNGFYSTRDVAMSRTSQLRYRDLEES